MTHPDPREDALAKANTRIARLEGLLFCAATGLTLACEGGVADDQLMSLWIDPHGLRTDIADALGWDALDAISAPPSQPDPDDEKLVEEIGVPMRHFGDPCIHCGTPHDEVEPGPCKGDPKKAIPLAYATVSSRPDGVQHYRVRYSTGAVEDIHQHVSYHAPYYHFGHKDELTQPPRYDESLTPAPAVARKGTSS